MDFLYCHFCDTKYVCVLSIIRLYLYKCTGKPRPVTIVTSDFGLVSVTRFPISVQYIQLIRVGILHVTLYATRHKLAGMK